jgi:hypothetical protein
MFTNSIIFMPKKAPQIVKGQQKAKAPITLSKKIAKMPKKAPQKVKGQQKANAPITSSKKIAKMTKKANVKAMVTQKLLNPKMTVNTALDPALIKDTISELINPGPGTAVQSAGPVEADTIRNLLLPKLYGLKNTKVVREILEVPANAGSVQGPSLYGCGGGGTPPTGSTSSWFFPEDDKTTMQGSGLVYCWMSLVACTFKQGGKGYCGRGINHEMEHALPCAAQVFASLLAQRLDLDENRKYRKHHVILFEVMKVLLVGKSLSGGGTVTEQMVVRYVYIIMRMIRRQQVILGLPSISVCNQKKCQLNLLKMEVDPATLKVSLRTNPDEVREIMDAVGSAKALRMTIVNSDKVKFQPCGWCGVNNKESAFDNDDRLRTLYASAYSNTAQQDTAIASAKAFKENTDKLGLLTGQCEKVCDKYNEMSEAEIVKGEPTVDLSRFIISASIIVLSVIIKSTYKELGVDTVHLPELFKWVGLAKTTLSDAATLEKLFGTKKNGADWVIRKSQELAEESGNVTTKNYLNCNDGTIRDLVEAVSTGGVLAGGGQTGGSNMDLDKSVHPRYRAKGKLWNYTKLPQGQSLPNSSSGTMDVDYETWQQQSAAVAAAAAQEAQQQQQQELAWQQQQQQQQQELAWQQQQQALALQQQQSAAVAAAAAQGAQQQQELAWQQQQSAAVAAAQEAQQQPKFDTLIDEINSFFRYEVTYPRDPRDNLGVEENIILIFDYFESGGTGTNPDFISAVELNIDNLTDSQIIELDESVVGERPVILPKSGLARMNTVDVLSAESGYQPPEGVESEVEMTPLSSQSEDDITNSQSDGDITDQESAYSPLSAEFGYQPPEGVESEVEMTPLSSQSEDDITNSQSDGDITDPESAYSQTAPFDTDSQTESEEGVLGDGHFSGVRLGHGIFDEGSQRSHFSGVGLGNSIFDATSSEEEEEEEMEKEEEEDLLGGGGAHNRPFGFGSGKKKSKKTKRKSNKKNTKRKTKRKSNKKTKRKSNKKNTKRKTKRKTNKKY